MRYRDTKFYRYIGSAIAHPKNFLLCLKYPFWKDRNVFTGKFINYHSTMYNEISPGWRKAFGKQLSKDIAKALKDDNISRRKWKDALQWSQIKEKWGSLVLHAITTDRVMEVLTKYELLSICYCEECGAPARYRTTGWVSFLCEDCFVKRLTYLDTKHGYEVKTYNNNNSYKKYRLTASDIPVYYSYKSGKKIDLVKVYGIDYRKIWGLPRRQYDK